MAKAITKQDALRVFLHLDYEAHSVFIEELISQICIHIATVVDMHAVAIHLQELQQTNLFLQESPSYRTNAEVN